MFDLRDTKPRMDIRPHCMHKPRYWTIFLPQRLQFSKHHFEHYRKLQTPRFQRLHQNKFAPRHEGSSDIFQGAGRVDQMMQNRGPNNDIKAFIYKKLIM